MPQCGNYQLQTGQKDAYTTEPEIGHPITFRPFKHQTRHVKNKAEQTDTKEAEIWRSIIQRGLHPETAAQAMLEDMYEAAPDEETRLAVNLLEEKLERGEVIL